MSAAGLPPGGDHTMSDDPWRTPCKQAAYMDWTIDKGQRMLYVFTYEDGSSMATHSPKLGLRLLQRMRRAGLIEPGPEDAERAAVRRMELEALT